MRTDKLTKLKAIFDNATSVERVEKYGETTLVVRSFLSFIKRAVFLPYTDITSDWENGKEVLARMSEMPKYFLNKYGPVIFQDALAKTCDSQEKFWVLQEGFTLHNELSGIEYSPGDSLVKFHSKTGNILTADIKLVKVNHREIARLLVRTQDMRLSPRQLYEAVTKLGFGEKIPPSIDCSNAIWPKEVSDIVSITAIDGSTNEVYCTFRSEGHQGLTEMICPMIELEAKFPRITQALLATNAGDKKDPVLKAALLRKWWGHLPGDECKPVFFHSTEPVYALLMSSEYLDNIADKAVVLEWAELKSFGLGGRKGLLLKFCDSSIGRSYICDVRTFDKQIAYLGLTPVVDLIKLLELNETEAVGPVLTAISNNKNESSAKVSLGDIPLI